MKYLVSQIEVWREELAALPPQDPGRRKVGKEQAVALMAKELQAAARRGYTADELADVLATKGLDVHGHTLRKTLRKARRGATAPRARSLGPAGDGKGDRPGGNPDLAAERGPGARGGAKGKKVGVGEAVIAESVRRATGGPRDAAMESGRDERRNNHAIASTGAMSDGSRDGHPSGDAPLLAAVPPPEGAGRTQGESEEKKAEAASGVAPDKRVPAAGKPAWASRATAPPGRGTFTPRKDSENI